MKFQKAQGQLINEQERQKNLKAFGQKITKKDKDELIKLKTKAEKALLEKEEIVNNAIYHNAFEWRFEFPEVLADDGSYIGFDAVIGNPPYSSKISKETKKLVEKYELSEYKFDPYALFVERGLQITKLNPIVCLIIPLTYLTNYYYYLLRKYLINNALIEKIVVFDGLFFEEANVDTSILLINGNDIREYFNWCKISPKELGRNAYTKRLFTNIKDESRYEIFEFISNEWDSVKKKIRTGSEYLKRLRKISLGMKLKGNANYVVSEKNENYPDVIYFGKDISYYLPPQQNHFFSWDNYIKIGGTQNHDIYKHKTKILIQAIRNLSLNRRIVATIDEEASYFIGTVNELTPLKENKDFIVDEYYLLAILISNLMNFYFKSQFTTISLTSAFLGEIPIKKTSEHIQIELGDLVRKIYFKKKENPEEDTTTLEAEIDARVYELYGLTDEEIRIVENS